MTITYYDRNGESITQEEWIRLFEADERIIGNTELSDGAVVSTVWLGLNHQFGDGPPLIFESMVFGGPLDETQRRYSTEAEARAGHEALVEEADRA